MLRRDHHARRKPLEVPLERGRQRLVEIVDVEDHVALRRREAAEVHQVRVAAGLHPHARWSASWRGRRPSARPSRGRTRTATPTCARSGSGSGSPCGPHWIRSAVRPDRAGPWAPSIPHATPAAPRRAAPCPWRGVRRRTGRGLGLRSTARALAFVSLAHVHHSCASLSTLTCRARVLRARRSLLTCVRTRPPLRHIAWRHGAQHLIRCASMTKYVVKARSANRPLAANGGFGGRDAMTGAGRDPKVNEPFSAGRIYSPRPRPPSGSPDRPFMASRP